MSRDQWDQPGEMIHIDTRQLARFRRVGIGSGAIAASAARGEPVARSSTSLWMTPPAWPSRREVRCSEYLELLPDVMKATTVGFLARALGWISEQGNHLPSDPQRQRLRLLINNVAQRMRGPGSQADPRQALHAPHQRQGVTVHPHPAGGVGRWDGAPDLGTNATSADRAVWGSRTLAGATRPWVVSGHVRRSSGFGSLNDPVRNHA